MTPARLAEIRAYIERLDLNQLPGWTVEQRIIADLYEENQALRDEITDRAEADLRAQLAEAKAKIAAVGNPRPLPDWSILSERLHRAEQAVMDTWFRECREELEAIEAEQRTPGPP